MKRLITTFWGRLFRRMRQRNQAINTRCHKNRATTLFHLDPP